MARKKNDRESPAKSEGPKGGGPPGEALTQAAIQPAPQIASTQSREQPDGDAPTAMLDVVPLPQPIDPTTSPTPPAGTDVIAATASAANAAPTAAPDPLPPPKSPRKDAAARISGGYDLRKSRHPLDPFEGLSPDATKQALEIEAYLREMEQQERERPLGLDVAMLWGGDLLAAAFYPKAVRVEIGSGTLFPVPDDLLGKVRDTLVVPVGEEYGLAIGNTKAQGDVLIGDQVYSLEDVRAGRAGKLQAGILTVDAKTKALLRFGEFTFVVNRLRTPPKPRRSYIAGDSWLFMACFAIAALVVGGPIMYALTSPDVVRRAKYDPRAEMERLIEVAEIEIKQEEDKPKEDDKKDDKKVEDIAPLAPKPDSASKVIRPDPVKQIEQRTNLSKEERDAEVKKVVADRLAAATKDIAGDLRSLGLGDDMPKTRLYGAGGTDVAGGGPGGSFDVIADPTGSGAKLGGGGRGGPGGLGGPGGPGADGADGKQPIAGLGKAEGSDKVKVEIKEKKQTSSGRVGGVANASGDLDQETVRRVIATKVGAIKACYQKELQKSPNLHGKVTVSFLIGPSGAVTGVKIAQSTMGSPPVEQCITSRIQTWQFPPSRSGGTTRVNYPFNFSAK